MSDIQKKKRKTRKEFFQSLAGKEGFVYHLTASNTFKKDIDLCYKRNLDLNLLEEVIVTLALGEKLDKKYQVHKLQGIAKKTNIVEHTPTCLINFFPFSFLPPKP